MIFSFPALSCLPPPALWPTPGCDTETQKMAGNYCKALGGDEIDARFAQGCLDENHKSGGDRRVQGDSKGSEAPFYTIFQFFSLPALVAHGGTSLLPIPAVPGGIGRLPGLHRGGL